MAESTEATLKRTKNDRRTAKSAFTRAGTALQHAIKSKRPPDEVRQALTKYQGPYDSLVAKHNECAVLIDTDESYELEEQWLAECQVTFMKQELDGKIFIESLKKPEHKDLDMSGGKFYT